jgi:hypothetical protein
LFELEVDGAWEILGELVSTNFHTFDANKTVTRIRVTNTNTSDQLVYNAVKAYSNQKPLDVGSPETINWCLMIPKDPSALAATYGEDIPFGWIDCSGPNDGASCIVNTANPNFGESVRLLYLTLQPAVVEF